MQFPNWNPNHFLDTAEMTYILAIAYDWLYDSWSESQKSLLRKTILDKGLKPVLQGYSQHDRWTEVENNWNWCDLDFIRFSRSCQSSLNPGTT